MELEVGIWATRLGFGLGDRNLGLKTGIWASRLGFEGGRDVGEEEEEEEGGGENPPYVCFQYNFLWFLCVRPPPQSLKTGL